MRNPRALETLINKIGSRHAEFHGGAANRAALAVELGETLIDLKAACGHGNFQQTVRTRLPFSYSTASDFMKLAREGVKVGHKNARGLRGREGTSVRQALAYVEDHGKPARLAVATRNKLTAHLADSQEQPEWECTLMYGDCFERLDDIDDQSIDLILADLPSGLSHLPWDKPLDLNILWTHYKRIIKPNCPIVLFATQPYATDLIASNREWFRYDWIWVKSRMTGFVHAPARPLRQHENILVFSGGTAISPVRSKNTMPYYPLVVPISEDKQSLKPLGHRTASAGHIENNRHNRLHAREFTNYPGTILNYPSDTLGLHPTAKPIPLLRFLIETYTRPGNLVLDNTMGSGSCGVACAVSGRRFIGIEQELDFLDRAFQAIHALNRNPSSQSPPEARRTSAR